jgi:hypothetical protein
MSIDASFEEWKKKAKDLFSIEYNFDSAEFFEYFLEGLSPRAALAAKADKVRPNAELSEPISGYPPNKYRALSQQISNKLHRFFSKGHDFVGAINCLEELFKELEKDKLVELSDYLSPQD